MSALVVPIAPAGAAPAPQERAGTAITGTWKGRVVNQDGPAGYSGTIRLTRSKGSYRATVVYSRVGTRTRWVDDGRRGGWFRFREIPRASTDDGTGGTEIKVRRQGAALLVRYYVRDADYRGSMRAHRLR